MALLVIIALLGVSSATLDFFLDAEESRDLGLEGPLYFIQKGELIREALVPIYTHIIPLQKTTIRYKWRARKTRWDYAISFQSSDETVMVKPTARSLVARGIVPQNVSAFEVSFPCTGNKQGMAIFKLALNVTSSSSVLSLRIDQRKLCQRDLSNSNDGTVGPGSNHGKEQSPGDQKGDDNKEENSQSKEKRSMVYYMAISILATVIVIVLIIFSGYQYRQWQNAKLQKQRKMNEEAELCTLRSLPGGESLNPATKTQIPNGNCTDSGYNSCLIDSDNVLAGKLKSVAIDRSRVLFSTVIKQGSYGVFCCGTFLHVSRHGDETDDEHRPERQSQLGEEVFVKAITSTASVWDIQQFLISASSLIVSQHRNVLHVLGISSIKSGPPIVVYPLMPDGHILKDLLVKRRETDAAGAPLHPLSVPQLVFITAQVARGVNHLARNKLIHKDIAARNCLVTSRLHVRVMDGSLGIDLFPSEYDSIDQTRCRYPIRWMAAECLGGRPATIESDVWSFGVAMWEIMTHGDIPYANMVVERLLTVLQEGRRLEQPSSCPNQVFSLMGQCWALSPEDRPNFHQLTIALHEFYTALTCFI